MKKTISTATFLFFLFFITIQANAMPIEKKHPKKKTVTQQKPDGDNSLEKVMLRLMYPTDLLIAEKRAHEGREMMFDLIETFNLLNTKDPDIVFQKTKKRMSLHEIEANLKEIIPVISKVQRQLRKDEYILLMYKRKHTARFKQLATSLSIHANNLEKEKPDMAFKYHYYANIFYVLYLRNKQESRDLIARISKPLKQYGVQPKTILKKEDEDTKKKEEKSSNLDTIKSSFKLLQTLIKLETEELIKKIKNEIESIKKKHLALKQQYMFRALVLRYIIKQKIARLEAKIKGLLKRLNGFKRVT